MRTDRQSKLAFTLAEILIVLGIIGIVAEMTIPSLVQSYQKTQYVTGLKKAYAEFNQALIQMAADSNCVGDLQCTGLFDNNVSSVTAVGTELVKYFKILKNCDTTKTGCTADAQANFYNGANRFTGQDIASSGNYRFITAGGIAYDINSMEDCTHVAGTGNFAGMCGQLRVDVNGPAKGPNNWGRDIFLFWITNGSGPLIVPWGVPPDSRIGYWKTTQMCTNAFALGIACGGRVLDEGWKMNY